MHYYEHHLGDYAAATAHLSWDEDMAYRRLICAYYHNEKPIPLDVKDACRLVRAQSSAQRKAVEAVLREFFEARDDGWHQKRCDEEIARARDKSNKARGSANKRWGAKPSDSECNASAMRSHTEGNAPNPNPNPNIQVRDSERAPDSIPEELPDPEKAAAAERAVSLYGRCGEYAKALRDAGMKVTPENPVLVAWVQEGYLLPMVFDALQRAKDTLAQFDDISPKYVDKILRDNRGRGIPANVLPYRKARELP